MDIPLVTKLNAPLKAELDISIITEQLKELIAHEVKQAVSVAMKDLAENIVNCVLKLPWTTYKRITILQFQLFNRNCSVILSSSGIRTSIGINSVRLADIRNKGYFICEKPGIFLIAISLVTHSPGKIVKLYKNSLFVTQIRLTHDYIDETTTLTLLLQLNIGDTLSLKAAGDVHIHGKEYSEQTILKITT
ncbi:unnamed protein product [Mytilus coruscus]|uniref:Uncharacterized protein n=1 Tax=Mytilus coruscus TaxID=42192 RepID=A0A6J8CU21_MYTCO|nr:unnamed protein product [Mytilus coruscus]